MSVELSVPSGVAFAGSDQFPDPFQDIASLNMPSGIRSALRTCERVFMANGSYRTAMHRILSYFLTDIEIKDASDDEREKYIDFLTDTIGTLTSLQQMYIDRMCYGNSFASLLVPFRRFLACRRCGAQFPLSVVYNNKEFRFRWVEYQFMARCPRSQCDYDGSWKVIDRPEDLEKRLRIKIWNPHEIEILHDLYTDECHYLWRIPEDYKLQIRKGHLFHLERASMPVINAIRRNQMFRFHPDILFHMREPVPSGIRSRGWGIPRILTNFRQIYYVQVLRRYNEALALDYIIPFRLITPVARTGASSGGMSKALDPLLTTNMGDFSAAVRSMIRRRRRDPSQWCVLPFPVQYQSLGGDASQLAPRDLLDQGLQQLLNDAGTPIEMYNGSLSLQTAPVALRLFEATNFPLVRDGNQFLAWLIRQVSQVMGWEAVDAKLKRVTYADDVTRQMALLQLMTGEQISKTTGLASIGLSQSDEMRRLAEEAREQAETQAKVQEEMDESGLAQQMVQAQGPGGASGAAAGGAPAPSGGGGGGAAAAPPAPGMVNGIDPSSQPVTAFVSAQGPNPQMDVQSMQESASQLAQALVALPHSQRVSQMRELKQNNESLHALVKGQMEKVRKQAPSGV